MYVKDLKKENELKLFNTSLEDLASFEASPKNKSKNRNSTMKFIYQDVQKNKKK